MRRQASALQRHALRVRLVAVISTLILAAVSLLSIVSVVILRQNLMAQAENALFLSAESVVSRIDSELAATGDVPSFQSPLGPMPPVDGFYLVNGEGVAPSSTYFGRDFEFRELTSAEITTIRRGVSGDEVTSTIDVDGLGSFLVLETSLESADGTPLTVISGIGLTEAAGLIGAFIAWEVAIGIAIAALTAVIGYRVVRSALVPLERVVAVADRVAQTPMSSGEVARQERVPLDDRDGWSEAERVARALNKLLEHVESSLNARHHTEESMRRFIAEASHELRNPLASIRGYADFYARARDEEEVSNALDRIGAEAARMSALVESLLLLTRLDADPTLSREEVELSQLVLETVSDARFAYPEHRWQISLPAESAIVIGDDDAIRRILLNLIANAGHHTPPGTIVTVSMAAVAGATEITVRDDGPGIPAKALPTLFDRFTQAGGPEGWSTRDTTTVGLGLAIVRALATASGYVVTVASGPRGTSFTVQIPSHPAPGPG
ncbi:HAMP domain-containing sensor histidine kinase [Okibacterium endophyticum]